MNREIKFRAWDIKEKEMLSFGNIVPMRWIYDGSLEDMFDNCQDDIEIMQFTELKDKNGIEIYEGDIVNQSFMGGIFGQETDISGEVCWSYDCWRINDIKNQQLVGIMKHCKVVGNIYENKELLEASDD